MSDERSIEKRISPALARLRAATREQFLEVMTQVITQVFRERRAQYVLSIAQRLATSVARPTAEKYDELEGSTWVGVESLSQLRALVGGRFQHLKQRWMDAGLPLREHRGDRSGRAKVSAEGWAELSSWTMKQGFEIRLEPDGAEHLMRVRRVSKREEREEAQKGE